MANRTVSTSVFKKICTPFFTFGVPLPFSGYNNIRLRDIQCEHKFRIHPPNTPVVCRARSGTMRSGISSKATRRAIAAISIIIINVGSYCAARTLSRIYIPFFHFQYAHCFKRVKKMLYYFNTYIFASFAANMLFNCYRGFIIFFFIISLSRLFHRPAFKTFTGGAVCLHNAYNEWHRSGMRLLCFVVFFFFSFCSVFRFNLLLYLPVYIMRSKQPKHYYNIFYFPPSIAKKNFKISSSYPTTGFRLFHLLSFINTYTLAQARLSRSSNYIVLYMCVCIFEKYSYNPFLY